MNDKFSKKLATKLLQQGRLRGINRRDFMQSMVASGVTLASASSLWSTNVVAQTPKKGGVFRIGKAHGQTADSLDPGTAENGFTLALMHGLHNYLTEVGQDGSVLGEVAESWEASEGAVAWTFKLRPGMTFHNGRAVKASDVVASINHHRGKDSTSAAKPVVAPIVNIEAKADDVVVITLEAGNADFPIIMSDYHLPICQANEDGTMDWQSGIGCGPYTLKKFEPGVRADLVKFADYWKTNRAHFDEVQMITIVDPASRTNALISGEVDSIDRVDLKTVSLLARNPKINIHSIAGTQHYTYAMHTNVAPFDNNDVRLALKYAINRDELVEKILQGYGEVGNDHPIGSGQRFYTKDLQQRSYDPEKAKEHLKKAGLDSLTVDLHVADAAYAGAVDAASLYAESAKAANININVVREPNDGYWSNVWLKKPFCAVYWGGRPTSDWMFSTTYESGVAWNDTFFEHEKFNQLLKEARSELDQDKRKQMYAQMQSIVNTEGGTIIPMFASYVFASTDKVGYEEPMASNWSNDGERSMERWWFKS